MTPESDAAVAGGAFVVEDLSGIEAVVSEMWRAASESAAVPGNETKSLVRVSLGNVVVIADRERTPELSEVLDRLSVRRPSRVLVCEIDKARESPGVEAMIRAVCHRPSPDSPQVCCEHIHLRLGPKAYPLLAGIVRPLLEADLPSLIWWDRDWDDCEELCVGLVKSVGSLLIDLERTDSYAGLNRLRKQLGGIVIHDLAWARIEPWRRELAHVFDDSTVVGLLREIREVRISAEPDHGMNVSSEGLLFLGWLARQLKWKVVRQLEESSEGLRGAVEGPSGEIQLTLEAVGQPADRKGAGGDRASAGLSSDSLSASPPKLASVDLNCSNDCGVRLTSLDHGKSLAVSVTVARSCPLPRRATVEAKSPEEFIGVALESSLAADPVYEGALGRAMELIGA